MIEGNPLVTIIVRTKDRPKLLKTAIQSIAAQTYRPIEAVVVNDGGGDPDVEELRDILGKVSLNYIRLDKNMGRSHAGNVGIDHARGDYVGFLDDDDELYPEHLATLVPLLSQIDFRVAYTDSMMVYKNYGSDTHDLVVTGREVTFSRDFDYDFLIFENYIPSMCLLFTREVLVDSGGFDTSLEIYEDWDLLIRIGEKHPFYHIRKITANYNQWDGDLQISQRNKDYNFVEQSYQRLLAKHVGKIDERRLRKYISLFVRARDAIKELKSKSNYLENSLAESGEKIKTCEQMIGNLDAVIRDKDATIGNLRDTMREEASGESPEAIIRDKDATIGHLDAVLRNKESCIEKLEAVLGNKESCIEKLDAVIKDKDTIIVNLGKAIGYKDSHIENLDARMRDRDATIGNLHAALKDKDAYTEHLNAILRDRDRALEDKDSRVEKLETVLRDKNEAIERLETLLREKDQTIRSFEAALRDGEMTLNNIYNSNGWRALLIYYRIRDALLPHNTKRRALVKVIVKALRSPITVLRGLTVMNMRKFIYYLRNADATLFEHKMNKKLFTPKDHSAESRPAPVDLAVIDRPDVLGKTQDRRNAALIVGEKGSLRMQEITRSLRDFGWYPTVLNNEGNVEEYLKTEGCRFSVVIGAGAKECFDCFPFVRAYSPNSKVTYDAEDCGDDVAWMEFLNASVADYVIVDTEDKKKRLSENGSLRIQVVPDGPDMKAALEKLLTMLQQERATERADTADKRMISDSDDEHAQADERPGPEDGARRGSVLVVGVYLADQENAIQHIVKELNQSKNWIVRQKWIAIGGDASTDDVQAVTILRLENAVPKFVLINRILSDESLDGYDYVVICDDDIALPNAFLDDFLDLQNKYNLAAAQPARTHNSYIDHFFVEQLDGLDARQTRFVEIGPLVSFRKDMLPFILPFDESTPMGWGVDFVLPCIAEKHGLRIGIIDATPVDHSMRKPMQNYQYESARRAMESYLSMMPHLSIEEAFTIVESYGNETPSRYRTLVGAQ